jgi:hypothetical protein
MDEACRPHCVRGLQLLNRHVSSLNIFIWAIALCSHAACKSFAGLFTVRFILGMCEGSITAGFMIVSSMFYTRREHTARVGYWCECYDLLPNTPCLTLAPTPPLTVLMNGTGSNTMSGRPCKYSYHRSCSSNYLWFHQLWFFAHSHRRI